MAGEGECDIKLNIMAERDKVEELIAYLNSLGFEGKKFEEDVRAQYLKHEDAFTVKHQRMFGEEVMEYELAFTRDWQFMTYRLEGYIARLRLPVTIEHEVIRGIDTAVLETRMASVDWEKVLESLDGVSGDSSAAQIRSDLLQLTALSDSLAEYLQSQLMFKYYPRERWDDGVKELSIKYEREHTFTADRHRISNAILAYNTLSGRLDRLFDKLSHIHLDHLSDFDLYDHLKHHLSTDTFLFDLYFSATEKEGVMDYHIRVIKHGKGFEPEFISTTLTRYPDFSHGIYNGVDTEELEAKMTKIQWGDSNALFTPDSVGDAVMRLEIATIIKDIYKLVDSSQLDVATYLCMKYVWNTDELHDYIAGSIYERHSNLPTLSADFSLENKMKGISMYNLLCGRLMTDQLKEADGEWLKVKRNPETSDNSVIITKVKGLTSGELYDQLAMLPMKDPINLLHQLILCGNIEEVNLKNGEKILVSIGSDGKDLALYTSGMRAIPFNFRFDPEWNPPELKTSQAEVLSPDEKPKPKKDRSKSSTRKI